MDTNDDAPSLRYMYATNNPYGVLDDLEADDGAEPDWVCGTDGGTSEKTGTKQAGPKKRYKNKDGERRVCGRRPKRRALGRGWSRRTNGCRGNV